MKPLSELKVAIVHDWLIGGGAEQVVLSLHEMFPDAPIYTSYSTKLWRQKLDGKVVTGYLQYFPFAQLRKFIPVLRILWFSSIKLDKFDLVISSSGAEAKGINTSGKTIHINYCHAPTHYYWSLYDEYLNRPGFGSFDWLAKIGLKTFVGPLRKWDEKAAMKPNYIIANSSYTQTNVKKYYHRSSVVIHPPVDTSRFEKNNNLVRSGFVITGRQTPYKRIDLAIEACTQLNLPLAVIGDGPDHTRLLSIAGPSVSFITNASDEKVVKKVSSAVAFIFPGVDDFGISAVEALSAGTPVIAYKGGGALDYIKPKINGTFFDPSTKDALIKSIGNFKPQDFEEKNIKKTAVEFSSENFIKKMNEFITDVFK